MRVLFFCPQFAPLIGGAERQAEHLGKSLVQRGVHVVLMTPRLDAHSPGHEDRDGMTVRRFPLQDLSTGFRARIGVGLINAPWIALQIVTAIWQEVGRADLVHCHIGCLQSISAGVAARLRGRPVICKAAHADQSGDLGEMAAQGVMSRLFAALGRVVFTRWVATTEAVAGALARFGVKASDIEVLPNGVELTPTARQWRPRPVRRFLYLGRISRNADRDVPALLRAFDRLAGSLSDVELALVGDGDLLDQARQIALGCEHAGRIRLPGSGDPQHWLSWADSLVLPSRREGLSNALLEAMSMGLPCIANDIPPNREVLADGAAGRLVPVGDVDALADAMRRLAGDLDLATSMSIAALSRVDSRYSMASVTDRYLTLYAGLCKSTRSKP